MKVLFVSSGNSQFGISPLIKAQMDSLIKSGIEIDHFPIVGHGWLGYLQNVKKLRKVLRTRNYQVIHSHYALSAFVSTLAGANPHVVSLMGSDIKSGPIIKLIIKLLNHFCWKACIVKSQQNKKVIGINKANVIPNGVDMNMFFPTDKNKARVSLQWDTTKQIVLFASNPERPEKNFILAKEAISRANIHNIDLRIVYDISHADMRFYFNAANLLILTSFWEGSPNVIKEAMACNCPVVTTDVGDVKWLLGTEPGYYITSFLVEDVAEAIIKALTHHNDINGRSRILKLGLNEDVIAKQIIDLYHSSIS